MPCYTPNQAYMPIVLDERGKRHLRFDAAAAFNSDYYPIDVACGKCVGCIEMNARELAIRCMHEAQMHECNSFITLTYNDDYLPDFGSLKKRDVVLFNKRLRKYLWSKYQRKVVIYYAGEYGDKGGRPHYHALIFGHDFPDKVLYQVRGDNILYTSNELDSIWTDSVTGASMGFCSVGTLEFESAAYVARYVHKKRRNILFDSYTICDVEGNPLVDEVTGRFVIREPEFGIGPRRRGLGRTWYDKYKDSVYANDRVVVNGRQFKPPRYYDSKFRADNPDEYDYVKFKRYEASKSGDGLFRLRDREVVAKARLKLRERALD